MVLRNVWTLTLFPNLTFELQRADYVCALRVDAILHLAPPAGLKGRTYIRYIFIIYRHRSNGHTGRARFAYNYETTILYSCADQRGSYFRGVLISGCPYFRVSLFQGCPYLRCALISGVPLFKVSLFKMCPYLMSLFEGLKRSRVQSGLFVTLPWESENGAAAFYLFALQNKQFSICHILASIENNLHLLLLLVLLLHFIYLLLLLLLLLLSLLLVFLLYLFFLHLPLLLLLFLLFLFLLLLLLFSSSSSLFPN